MTQLEQLIDLNAELNSILDTEYSPEGRPPSLIEVLASVMFMCRHFVHYKRAKLQQEGSIKLYNADSELKLFGKSKVNLLKRLDFAIKKPQIFKEHACGKQILAILKQMRQVAPDASIEASTSMLHSQDLAKLRSASSSDESATVGTGTPASQQFVSGPSSTNRTPSPDF